jgi:hypothetical protein
MGLKRESIIFKCNVEKNEQSTQLCMNNDITKLEKISILEPI